MQYKIVGPNAKFEGNCVKCGARTTDVLIKSDEGKFAVMCGYHLVITPMSIAKRQKKIAAKSGQMVEVA